MDEGSQLPTDQMPKTLAELSLDMIVTLFPAWASITVGFLALSVIISVYKMSWAGFLWALACLGAGSLIGIVFGIPRAGLSSAPGVPQQAGGSRLYANTNMEQISDWLTKLLVGAGLVSLKDVPHGLDLAAQYVAPALRSSLSGIAEPSTTSQLDPTLKSLAAAIIIYFSVEGFIGGYLIARVFFPIAFRHSDSINAANH